MAQHLGMCVETGKQLCRELNGLKPNVLKRVLQLPSSTPSDALMYDFGINDLSLDIMMEKIVLAVETMKRENERISRQLLTFLMENKVDGFCSELEEVCQVLGVSFEELLHVNDARKVLKEKIVKIQGQLLYKRMMVSSKMDGVLLNGFCYDGKIKKYLVELDFVEARAVLMMRYRMFPTKSNFPGRWDGRLCNICCFEDTDEHLFHCPGYQDLLTSDIRYSMFWEDDVLEDTERIKKAACVLLSIIERLEQVQTISGMKEKETT